MHINIFSTFLLYFEAGFVTKTIKINKLLDTVSNNYKGNIKASHKLCAYLNKLADTFGSKMIECMFA